MTVNHLNAEVIAETVSWCDSQSIDCLYFLADSDDAATVRLAEANQFQFMDIRVTLDRQLKDITLSVDGDSSTVVRSCVPDDVPFLRSIARVSHSHSRFYFDSNFQASRCEQLYETWIEKSCSGYADAVLVTELEGRPVGYISCHLPDWTIGSIGLLGVAPNAQGRGVGRSLIEGALRWFTAQGASQVTVVTQGRNCRAQRLYQSCGFKTQSMHLWYHRWFSHREL